jgi:hypothetical protein
MCFCTFHTSGARDYANHSNEVRLRPGRFREPLADHVVVPADYVFYSLKDQNFLKTQERFEWKNYFADDIGEIQWDQLDMAVVVVVYQQTYSNWIWEKLGKMKGFRDLYFRRPEWLELTMGFPMHTRDFHSSVFEE